MTVSSSVTTVLKYSAFKTFAGDIRNDLYVTLEKGEFEKGNEILGQFEYFFMIYMLRFNY